MISSGSRGKAGLGVYVSRFFLLALFAAATALYFADVAGEPRLRKLKSATVDRIAPVFETLAAPVRFVGGALSDFRSYLEVYDDNQRLRQEIQRLQRWNLAAQALDRENARLRALNNVRLPPRMGDIAAETIADSGGPFIHSRLVNVGALGGAVDGSAVVDGRGLVGRLVAVGQRASRVLLLTDPGSRAPVFVEPGGQRAILFGDGGPNPTLRFVSPNANVAVGASVTTSGDGRVFPRGVMVGHVLEASHDGVKVALAADYSALQFVRILRYEPVILDVDDSAPILREESPAPSEGPDDGV